MRGSKWRIASVALGSSLLSACGANYASIYRTDQIEPPQVVITDGEQRAITATMTPKNRLMICKERYPDVFSALASSGALSIEVAGKGAGQGAFSQSEQAAFAGLRTQLRESQARMLDSLCDFYAGGGLDEDDIEVLLRRFQNHVLAALAIEQLTGYARPTVVALGGKAQAGVGAGLAEAQKALDDAKKVLEEKQGALKSANAGVEQEANALDELKKADATQSEAATKNIAAQEGKLAEAKKTREEAEKGTDADAIKKAQDDEAKEASALEDLRKAEKTRMTEAAKQIAGQQGKLDEAKKKLTPAEEAAKAQTENVKTLEANRDAARQAVQATTASGDAIISQPTQVALSDKATEHVADAVENIVVAAFRQHYTADECQRYLFSSKFHERASAFKDPRTEFCLGYLKAIQAYIEKTLSVGPDQSSPSKGKSDQTGAVFDKNPPVYFNLEQLY